MTAVDVDALDKLREAAKYLDEWRYDPREPHTVRDSHPRLPAVLITFRDPGADAALIVAAVNALPDLLAEVRRGRALREAVLRFVLASDDGTEYEHQHPVGEGEPECPACWADGLRAALAATDGTP